MRTTCSSVAMKSSPLKLPSTTTVEEAGITSLIDARVGMSPDAAPLAASAPATKILRRSSCCSPRVSEESSTKVPVRVVHRSLGIGKLTSVVLRERALTPITKSERRSIGYQERLSARRARTKRAPKQNNKGVRNR